MKRLPFLLLCVLALLVNACEMHKASELEDQHHDQAAEHPPGAAAGHAEPGKGGEKKAEEGKPGEAPKFFPEKK
jgi:hypothetical protein